MRAVLLAPALLALGCHALHLNQPAADRPPRADREATAAVAAPSKYSLRVSPYVFLSDFELKRDTPLFRDLEGLRDQVAKELQLPTPSTLVQVYLFDTRDHYEHFIRSKYPQLPNRRAFFVAQPRGVGTGEDLLVYTYWGDRIQEDLRHELTHALLHSVLRDVPLWLDEGIAEYFEVPAAAKGVNARHLDLLRNGPGGPFKPDLARLEKFHDVGEMSPAEYREAWAWVHLLLRDRVEGKAVLVNYLHQLRVNPDPGLLAPRLAQVYPSPSDALEQHLARLDASPQRPPVLSARGVQ